MTGRLVHPFEPVYDREARVLILGTFPSAGSVEGGGYYGNPQNQFWSLMRDALGYDGLGIQTRMPEPGFCGTFDEDLDTARLDVWTRRYATVKQNRIALWDVVSSCTRKGRSADTQIDDVWPNDLADLIRQLPHLRLIAFTGAAAERLFNQLVPAHTLPHRFRAKISGGRRRLPSTSPANTARYADKLAAFRTAFREAGLAVA